MICRILIFLSALIISLPNYCQNNSGFFRSLTTKDGLSENHINCIIQDKQGFIWLGTDGGLNRFDGYEFKHYFFNPVNDTVLRSNIVQCMAEDHEGNIWIGTPDRGYYKFNIKTERYDYFGNKNEKVKKYLNSEANSLTVAHDGSVWFSGSKGIDVIVFNNKTKNYQVFNYNMPPYTAENNLLFAFRTIISDDEKRIWIGTYHGLFLAVNDTLSKKPFKLLAIPELEGTTILGMDAYGKELFLALEDGIYKGHLKKDNSFKLIKVCDDYSRRIKIDKEGNLIGGHDKGLKFYAYDSVNNKYIKKHTFSSDIKIPGSISENNITCISEDNSGILWIGTNIRGVNIFDPNRKKINYYHNLSNSINPTSLSVRSVYEDKSGSLWIGTMGAGLYYSESKNRPDLHKHSIYIPGPESDLFGYNTIFTFSECNIENESFLLIGAGYPLKFGFIPFSRYSRGEFTITPMEKFPSIVIDLMTDSEGIVWACTYGNGIFRLYPEKHGLNYWENINALPYGKGLSSNIVRSVQEDLEGNIWIGTANGLNLIKKKNKFAAEPDIEVFHYNPTEKDGISHDYILPLLLTKDGTLWIGTMGGGLNKLIRHKDGGYSFEKLTSLNGLPDNTIKGILEDEEGNIWISSNKGISRINGATGDIRNFDANDGLQDYEFLDLSCMKSKSGELFFGGVNGINSFYPKEMKDNYNIAIPVFTELQVLNNTIEVNEEINNRVILSKTISSTKKIELFYKENSFSIKFSALHFASPKKNNFKYKLEGFNENWVTTNGDNRLAKYTNLNPGKYTFRLMASNNDLHWNNEPAELDIYIKAPLLRSKVAFIVYFIMGTAMFILFGRYSLISKFKKNRLLLESIEKKQLEQVTQMKFRFFTDISHELRTPLSMIKGPVEMLIDQDDLLSSEQRNRLYKLISNSSNQILGLINQLLDFRKAELGKINLRVSKLDIIDFTNTICSNFSLWAEQKGLKLVFESEQENFITWFDPDVMRKILNNLLSNAIKYTPNKGSVTLIISMPKSDKRMVKIEVKDTGDGISETDIENIFERFHKTHYHSGTEMSTGIGLSFVNSLIKLHHGTIVCESKLGLGTSFIAKIPTEREAYQPEEIDLEETDQNFDYLIEEIAIPHAEPEMSELHKVKGGEIKILVVEDNLDIVNFLKSNMYPSYKVIAATNGEEGIHLAKKENPELIISDIMMPVKNGFEFSRELKSDLEISHIPLILLTAKATDEDKVEGYKSGADAYMIKPFNISVLRSQIESILRNKKILQEKFQKQIKVKPKEITATNNDAAFIERLIQFVENDIDNPNLNISLLSRHAGISATKLNIKLKAVTGLTTGAFIRSIRLKRSAQLLINSDMAVFEVIYRVGFSDIKYFRKCFKKEFSMNPLEFRKSNRLA